MICVPITAKSNADAMALLERAAREPADVHELRFDLLDEAPDIEGLIAKSARPVLATCRSRKQGGGFSGAAVDRARILQRAIEAGAGYVDAEEDVIPLLRRRDGVVILASWHDFTETPDTLRNVVARLAATGCDWVKFASFANSPEDNLKVFDALATSGKPAIGVAMGEMGLPSRVLGLSRGSRLTFGALGPGFESAPGQTTARDLAETYRVKSLTRQSAVYGLLGDPVRHSIGFRIHNRALAANAIDGVYMPFQCPDARVFLDAMPDRLGIRGLSVTMPHKLAALEWATETTGIARAAGAANTLLRTDTGWLADNTDVPAAAEGISASASGAELDVAGKPALILGAGGVARAIGVALASLGGHVHVSARDSGKAYLLASTMGWIATPWPGRERGTWAVVANGTPIGMIPETEDTPFPAGGWRPGMVAFESVYSPRRTRFLREAEAAGAATADGYEMFMRQAAGQFRLWTGRELPLELAASD